MAFGLIQTTSAQSNYVQLEYAGRGERELGSKGRISPLLPFPLSPLRLNFIANESTKITISYAEIITKIFRVLRDLCG